MSNIYKLLYFLVPRLRFIKHCKGVRYLDFGCGSGVALRQNLSIRPNLKCYCIDIENFSKDLPKNVGFVPYDGTNVPFHNDSFDVITANHVLEHTHNPNLILLELKRILKVGGEIFIETPNNRSLWGRPGGKFAGTVHFYDDKSHICPYSNQALYDLCRNVDFDIIKCKISRNVLHLALSPFLLIIGILRPKKLYFMYARNSVIGWASYIILRKEK